MERSMVLLALSCAGQPPDPGSGSMDDPADAAAADDTTDGSGSSSVCPCSDDLAGRTFEVQELTDVAIDWSGVTRSCDGSELAAESVSLIVLALPPDEVCAALEADAPKQSKIRLFATCESGDGICALSDFVTAGAAVDISAEADADLDWTWMVVLGDFIEESTACYAFLVPSKTSTRTSVEITDQTCRAP